MRPVYQLHFFFKYNIMHLILNSESFRACSCEYAEIDAPDLLRKSLTLI